jgi:hypothetical protein
VGYVACVNTRVTFNYTGNKEARFWSIVKSPLVANSSYGYRITAAGLLEVSLVFNSSLARQHPTNFSLN